MTDAERRAPFPRQNISIHGKERNAAEDAQAVERWILRELLRRYAGQPLPPSVRVRCVKAGVKV